MPFEQFPYTNFHELNDDWILKTVKDVKDKTDAIDAAVATTEQNAEICTNIYESINGIFVTPEMFGAVGDGVTDDSQAIQNAIDSGNPVYLTNKTYKTDSPLHLTGNVIFNDGIINYTGNDFALILDPSNNLSGINYNLGTVYAANGSCLKINSTNAFIQYVNIDFKEFRANAASNSVELIVVGNNWINEVRFNKGRFAQGLNGVYIDRTLASGSSYTSHIIFDEVGFEGITNGVNIPTYVNGLIFNDCRAEESLSNVVLSQAASFNQRQQIIWNGSVGNAAYWSNCPNYIILFNSGVISDRGVLICTNPVMLYNDNYHGLLYNQGQLANANDYGAHTYDSGTQTQETDFETIYNYTTADQYLWIRSYARYVMIPNNTSATTTKIYLDDRMFLPLNMYGTNNSYLLEMTLSPNVVLQIYNKKNGTLLYSKTNGASTTYPKYIITKAGNKFFIEETTITRKQV